MAERRDALMFVCPWLTEDDAETILAGEHEEGGPTFVERLAHHETEHREWMHLAMALWREAIGTEAPWPGSGKALAEVRAARAAPREDDPRDAVIEAARGIMAAWDGPPAAVADGHFDRLRASLRSLDAARDSRPAVEEAHTCPDCEHLPPHTTCWEDASGMHRWKNEKGSAP